MTRKQRKRIPRKKTESELAWEKAKHTYPNCTKNYPDCPPEIEDPRNPPRTCRLCPIYMERRR
ncbi:MAG: hypothetical protein D6733_00620 [Methanobacteriota archaeon]|nr:MAG: hypothetical protein D6733_00620 [Euryarchaeota archaeon]